MRQNIEATKHNSFRSRYLYIIIKCADYKKLVRLEIVDIHTPSTEYRIKLLYYNWVEVAGAWGNVCV